MRLASRLGITDIIRDGVSRFSMTSGHTNGVAWRIKSCLQSELCAFDQGAAFWFNALGVARNAESQGTFDPLARSYREHDRS